MTEIKRCTSCNDIIDREDLVRDDGLCDDCAMELASEDAETNDEDLGE